MTNTLSEHKDLTLASILFFLGVHLIRLSVNSLYSYSYLNLSSIALRSRPRSNFKRNDSSTTSKHL